MINLPTKFEAPNFTSYRSMKGVAKWRCKNVEIRVTWGSAGTNWKKF